MGIYVSPSGAAQLKAYKYVGWDGSLIYKKILTPMNIWLIEFFPLSMAPNVITLLGLFCCIAAHAITLVFNPSMRDCSQMPVWAYCAVAFLLFAYQTLDNLDGRQARRTGTSSPLGLLFDHGVDALNVALSNLTVCACICAGANAWFAFWMWSMTLVLFVHATWEEYYVGELVLGLINGPTEGILLACSFVLANVVFGPGVWCRSVVELLGASVSDSLGVPAWLRVQPACILICFAGIPPMVVTLIGNYSKVFSFIAAQRARKIALDAVGQENYVYKPEVGARIDALYPKPLASAHPNAHALSFGGAIFTLLPFVLIWAGALVWAAYSPVNILAAQTRMFIFAHGFLFSGFICRMMLAHLTLKPFRALHWASVPGLWAVANALVFKQCSEVASLILLLVFAVGVWAHFVFYVTREVAAALGIKIFSIPTAADQPPALSLTKKDTKPW